MNIKVREKKPKTMKRWKPKSKYCKEINSHHHARELIDFNWWRKWCEHCGGEFKTVNPTRRLCDKCHELKCELGGYPPLGLGKGCGHRYANQYSSNFKCGIIGYEACDCGGDIEIHRAQIANKKRWPNDDGRIRDYYYAYYGMCLKCGCVCAWCKSLDNAVRAVKKIYKKGEK